MASYNFHTPSCAFFSMQDIASIQDQRLKYYSTLIDLSSWSDSLLK